MVGLVIVSHSEKIALGVKELASQMAKDVLIAPAGGTDDGGIGTSIEKITAAINEANQGDGVVVLMDLGSAVMTAEMAIEMCDFDVRMADGPVVEGGVIAAVEIASGANIDRVVEAVNETKTWKKF